MTDSDRQMTGKALSKLVADLQAENARLRFQLQDLLAVIHGDGGHHTAKVGIEQSVKDAASRHLSVVGSQKRLKEIIREAKEIQACST